MTNKKFVDITDFTESWQYQVLQFKINLPMATKRSLLFRLDSTIVKFRASLLWNESIYAYSAYNKILRANPVFAKSASYCLPSDRYELELDRYIGNTYHRGQLWDNRNHRQMMTIGDQFVPMFHDDVTYRIRIAMGSIGHPCRNIQGSARYMSLMTVQALREVSICDETRPTTHAVLFEL